jgi:hypothetical protein
MVGLRGPEMGMTEARHQQSLARPDSLCNLHASPIWFNSYFTKPTDDDEIQVSTGVGGG